MRIGMVGEPALDFGRAPQPVTGPGIALWGKQPARAPLAGDQQPDAFACTAVRLVLSNIDAVSTGWRRYRSPPSLRSAAVELPRRPRQHDRECRCPDDRDLVYHNACDMADTSFEIAAVMESTRYQAREATDGGDCLTYYEIGTSLELLPVTSAF